MILATHGRALWILDHLEPIQEYAAAQAATTDAKLFTPPPYAMYRRPARDRNYEFWGDQTFFGENPPQAAVISWFNKKQVGDVKLKITDAAGREIREISGPVLANSNKAGIQSACWDLRVQPAPAPPPRRQARGRQARPRAGQRARPRPRRRQPPAASAAGGSVSRRPSPFGAGCGDPAGQGGGGGFGGAARERRRTVRASAASTTSSLIVDGKTVDTKPLRVNDDPEVVLTSVERKRMFDMAMEMHALQPRITEASAAHASLTRQITELATTIGGRSDVPADVKASFDAFNKELAALAPKLIAPQGGRGGGGGGRGGATESLVGQGRPGEERLMGGMSPGDQTVRAYTEVKAQTAEGDRGPQRRDREGDDAQRDAGAAQPDADGAGAGAGARGRAGQAVVKWGGALELSG